MDGYCLRTYMELLSKRGISVFDYTEEAFERDLKVVGELARERSTCRPHDA